LKIDAFRQQMKYNVDGITSSRKPGLFGAGNYRRCYK
jgi:hypothetical protein